MAAAGSGRAKDGDAPQPDWSQTGTCAGKPGSGWIHTDSQLSGGGGVCYAARYLGCVEVTVSMRTLDFETRTALSRDAIYRVAEATGLRSQSKKKKDKRLSKLLKKMPNLTHGGADVTVSITTDVLSLISMDNGKVLLMHKMEDISFVSGGDADTIDFVGYVGKEGSTNRACHVLECGASRSQQVILTIAQAFELRYKQILEKQNQKKKKMPVVLHESEVSVADESAWGDEPAYYNSDMEDFLRLTERPGGQRALPVPPPIPPLPSMYSARPSNLPVSDFGTHGSGSNLYSEADEACCSGRSPVYENTKDDLVSAAAAGSTETAAHGCADDNVEGSGSAAATYSLVDNTPKLEAAAATASKRCSPVGEPWFHGKLNRRETEALLQEDGDFLVRESTSSGKSGHYVLSSIRNGIFIHLLLVDPEGVVRTKDRTFDSVSHLISYHKDKRVPILSQDLELYLINGIVCSKS